MAELTNAYTTTDRLKAELNETAERNELRYIAAINAASRQIDGFCGRRFWQDTAVVDRQYYAYSDRVACVDDISTTTGLVVKLDVDDDGTFETTLTISTHFLLQPLNAADGYPVRPYNDIWLTDDSPQWFPRSSSGRPGLQVTAKFGWPAVPDDVEMACLIQAKGLYKAAATQTTGFQGVGVDGLVVRTPPLDYTAQMLLMPYRRVET